MRLPLVRSTRALVAAAAVLAAALVPAVTPARASAVVVDPALRAAAARARVPAVVAWDPAVAGRAEVESHLRGLRPVFLDELHMAIVCAGDSTAVEALVRTPGALSVWGDEPLVPQLDASVPTAFNGDPAAVWNGLGFDGEGVGVAVLDTGLDAGHPDLALGTRTPLNVRVVMSHTEVLGPGDPPPCQDVYSEERLRDSELTSGHGTHMASVAAGDGSASAGRLRGMAPAASLMGIAISDSVAVDRPLAGGLRLSTVGALAGFNYVLARGLDSPMRVKVALAAWTGSGLHDPYHPIQLAVRTLYEFGIVTVFPAGNGGPGPSDCSTEETCRFNPHAVGPYVVAAGATGRTERASLEDYSSRGDPVARRSRGEDVRYEPTLVAPGTGVVAARRLGAANVATPPGSIAGGGGSPTSDQTNPRYVALSGTSVAAAHVAGAIAVLQQAAVASTGCYLRSADVIRVLRSTATPLAGRSSWEAGAGALDATAAVHAARAVPPPAQRSRDSWMCP